MIMLVVAVSELIHGAAVCQVIAVATEDQLILVDMITAIKLLSIDSVMQTVRQVIKQPPQQTAILSASKVTCWCCFSFSSYLCSYLFNVDRGCAKRLPSTQFEQGRS